jgi:hypothetical protein
VVARLVVVAFGQFLEHVALGVLQLVLGIAEDEREVRHGQRRVAASGKAGAGQDDVHGAQRQALVDVGFLAQRGGGEHLDHVLAVGALGDLFAGPDRVLVEGLRGLVDVRPLQLRSLRARGGQAAGSQGGSAEGLEGIALVHHVACLRLWWLIERTHGLLTGLRPSLRAASWC